MPARALAFVAALLLVLLSLGVTGSAFADPGSGKALGNDNGNGNDGVGSQAASSFAVADNGTAGNGSSGTNGNGNGADNGNGPGVNNGNGGSSGNASDNAGSGNAGAVAANATTSTAPASSNESTAKGTSNNGQAKKQSSYVAPAKSSSGKGQTKTNGSSTAQLHKTKGTAGTSGDVSSPQPPSNADQNPGGANGDKCPGGGPYCSTRDGRDSMNGNGGGKAVGRPCMGCVGRADNKNPKGQYPDGKHDGNQGYECDGNHGIGKGNPAHTTCVPQPTCTQNCDNGGGGGCTVNCGGGGGGCTVDCTPPPPGCVPSASQPNKCGENPPPPKFCQQFPDSPACNPRQPVVKGEEAVVPQAGPAVVLGIEAFKPSAGKPAVAPAQAGALPSTGAEAGMGLAALGGFALLTVGVATLLLRRRTS